MSVKTDCYCTNLDQHQAAGTEAQSAIGSHHDLGNHAPQPRRGLRNSLMGSSIRFSDASGRAGQRGAFRPHSELNFRRPSSEAHQQSIHPVRPEDRSACPIEPTKQIILRGAMTLSVNEPIDVKQIMLTFTGVSETRYRPLSAKLTDEDLTPHREVLINQSHTLLDHPARQSHTQVHSLPNDVQHELRKYSNDSFRRTECEPGTSVSHEANDTHPQLQRHGRQALHAIHRRLSHRSSVPVLASPLQSHPASDPARASSDATCVGLNLFTHRGLSDLHSAVHALAPGFESHSPRLRPHDIRLSHPGSPSSRTRGGGIHRNEVKRRIPFGEGTVPRVVRDQVFDNLVSRVTSMTVVPETPSAVGGENHLLGSSGDQMEINPFDTVTEELPESNAFQVIMNESDRHTWGPPFLNFHSSHTSLAEEFDVINHPKQRPRSRSFLKHSWSNLSDIFKSHRNPFRKRSSTSLHPETLFTGSLNQAADHVRHDSISTEYDPTDRLRRISLLDGHRRSHQPVNRRQSLSPMIITPKPSLRAIRKVLSNIERGPIVKSSRPPSALKILDIMHPNDIPEVEDAPVNVIRAVSPTSTGHQFPTRSEDSEPALPEYPTSTIIAPGQYLYPFVITVPATLPPSLDGRFGSLAYRLRADVVQESVTRSDEIPIQVVDPVISLDTREEELGNELAGNNSGITVERIWENQLHYIVSFNHRKCLIGGSLNLEVILNPLCEMKVYKISAFLVQKVSDLVLKNFISSYLPVSIPIKVKSNLFMKKEQKKTLY